MELSHTQKYIRLLESISFYAKKSLELLEYGKGDLPQWANDKISEIRTHIKDVTHFLRGQADHGIRYGAHDHGRAYMATKNLREIAKYADESLSYVETGAGLYPAWVEQKIAVCAEYMDMIGHWLENESVEGRRYGRHRPGHIGGGPVAGGRGRPGRMGRPDPTGPHHRPRHGRHRRSFFYPQTWYPGYSYPIYEYVEAYPEVGYVTYKFLNSSVIITLHGRNLNRIPKNYLYIVWSSPEIQPHTEMLRIINRNNAQLDIQLNAPSSVINVDDVSYLTNYGDYVSLTPSFSMAKGANFAQSPGMSYQSGYGSIMASGPAPTAIESSKMEYMLPHSRMIEPHRMGILHRQLWHQTGRRFGVPGFKPGEPGWAGQAGIAQKPCLGRG